MTAQVFEDDRLLAALICEALGQICTSVHHSATLAEFQAHRAAFTEGPGLVWMDLLADGNTIEDALAETSAVRQQCPNSIIVVMTGVALPGIQEMAIAAGADAVAIKPFTITILDLARLIAIGAINAMDRGASNSPRVLQNVCEMACKYFATRRKEP